MPKAYSDWTEADLDLLITDRISEGLSLEYKRDFGNIDQASVKKELCKDISAMANSQGGILIVGLEEATESDRGSIPVSLCPLSDRSLKERVQQILISGINPPADFRFWVVESSDGSGEYNIIEVPKSLRGVHMVTLQRENRYYIRRDFEVVRMSPYEVENAFHTYMLSEEESVKRLEQYHSPTPNGHLGTPRNSWLGVTIVPRFLTPNLFSPYCYLSPLEIERIGFRSDAIRTRDGLYGSDEFRPTFDGLQSEDRYESAHDENRLAFGYQHIIFRDGAIHYGFQICVDTDSRVFYPKKLLRMLHDILAFTAGLLGGVDYYGPIDILIDIDNLGPLSIEGHSRSGDALRPSGSRFTTNKFEHNLTTSVRELEDSIPKVIQEVMDHMWHSFGKRRCVFYRADTPGVYVHDWIEITNNRIRN